MRGEWIEIVWLTQAADPYASLPMRGEWIEISTSPLPSFSAVSLPMRGEWIEMVARRLRRCAAPLGLSPCGESGLKFFPDLNSATCGGLSPCGESGLKWAVGIVFFVAFWSLPMRGEWIEI